MHCTLLNQLNTQNQNVKDGPSALNFASSSQYRTLTLQSSKTPSNPGSTHEINKLHENEMVGAGASYWHSGSGGKDELLPPAEPVTLGISPFGSRMCSAFGGQKKEAGR